MSDDSLDALRDLGFTESEARVYLALMDGSPATGYRIGLRASIPRSMVYEALGRLEARGAVLHSGEGRGRLYRPVPVEDVLDRLEREHRRRAARALTSLSGRRQPGPTPGFWTGHGREVTDAYGRRLLSRARREVFLVLPDAAMDSLGPALEAAGRRGVRLGVVTTGRRRPPSGFWVRHPPGESEAQRLAGVLLLCTDEREVLIADLKGEGRVTVTQDALVVHIARQFVWMELLTQCLHRRGADALSLVSPDDRAFLEPAARPARARRRGA